MTKVPDIELLRTAYRPEQMMELKGPAVLFLGRSNVGKSSLLNALARTQLAQVSKTPGKTRSVNYFRWGKSMTLVDLPGFGYARRSKEERAEWARLIKAFFDGAPPGLAGFILVDGQRSLEGEEMELMQALIERSYPVMILLTKADRLNQSARHHRQKEMEAQLKRLGWENALSYGFVSVKTGEGLAALRDKIYQYEKDFFL